MVKIDNKTILGMAAAFLCISTGITLPYYFLHYIPTQNEIKQAKIDTEKSDQDALRAKEQCRKTAYDFYSNFKKENEMSAGTKMITITDPSWHISKIDHSTCLVGFHFNIFDASGDTVVHYEVFNADTGKGILTKGQNIADSIAAESDFQDQTYDSGS